ncbi:MAG: hypothetical protein ACLFWG_05810, partial [Longimicrobiales bacterium]
GLDQHGELWHVSYQPDWLRHVKVTRQLESGRQSTMTLFRNPREWRKAEPGDKVRTRIVSDQQDLEFQVSVIDPSHQVTRIRVAYRVPSADDPGAEEEIELTLENSLPEEPE